MDWWTAGNNWLCQIASEHYVNWCKTRAGKQYLNSKKKGKSPYYFGYSQPAWMDDARKALGDNDEETFKAIKLREIMYL